MKRFLLVLFFATAYATASWANIESVRGTYDWSDVDFDVAQCLTHGIEPYCLIVNTPAWASPTGQNTHEYAPLPQYEPDFQAFCTALAARYAGQIYQTRLSRLSEVEGVEFEACVDRLGDPAAEGRNTALARLGALVTNPQLLLMDEPSEGLSVLVIQRVEEVCRQLSAGGMSILLIEQNIEMAQSLAQRAYVFVNGRIARELTAATLAANPNPLQESLGVTAGADDLPALRYLLTPPTDDDVAAYRETARRAREQAERHDLLTMAVWGVGYDAA